MFDKVFNTPLGKMAFSHVFCDMILVGIRTFLGVALSVIPFSGLWHIHYLRFYTCNIIGEGDYAKPCYESLWATLTHNDPKYSHYDPLWWLQWLSTITFYFPKFCPKNTFLGESWSRNLKVLCLKSKSVQRGTQSCLFLIRQLFS